MTAKTLKSFRKKIDRIDAAIIQKLAERRKVVREVGRLKARAKMLVKDPARERAILKHYRTESKRHKLDPQFVHQLFRHIIRYSRLVQK